MRGGAHRLYVTAAQFRSERRNMHFIGAGRTGACAGVLHCYLEMEYKTEHAQKEGSGSQ